MTNSDQKRKEIFGELQNIISDIVSIDISHITPESRLIEDLGFDSLDIAELELETEKQLFFGAPQEAWDNCKTVNDIVNCVFDNKVYNDEY